jgi:hypothetical protein
MKYIQTHHNKINVIEEFISKQTCDYLIDSFKPVFKDTPNKTFRSGPSFDQITNGVLNPVNSMLRYNESVPNMAVDLYNNIAFAMQKTMSDFFDMPLDYKTLNFSVMLPGGKNVLHMDNVYLDSNLSLKDKPFDSNDRSGLLYLNDCYEGGELYFPRQDFKIKPWAGTFIFFEGNSDLPHEVLEVTSGERYNIISFLWHKDNNGNPVNRHIPEQEWEMTRDNLGITH